MSRKSSKGLVAAVGIAAALGCLYLAAGMPHIGRSGVHLLPVGEWGFSADPHATVLVTPGTAGPNTLLQISHGSSTRAGFVRVDRWQGTVGKEVALLPAGGGPVTVSVK